MGSAVTDKDGIARLNYKYNKAGTYTITTKYNGNETYLASNANGQTIVSKTPTKLTIKKKGNKIILILTDEDGIRLKTKK